MFNYYKMDHSDFKRKNSFEKRYQESDFADAISKAPYAIWIGRHESQGFAFQETLSSDTPIFVIDVNSGEKTS